MFVLASQNSQIQISLYMHNMFKECMIQCQKAYFEGNNAHVVNDLRRADVAVNCTT